MLQKTEEFIEYLIEHKKQHLIDLCKMEIDFNDSISLKENYDIIYNIVLNSIYNDAKPTKYVIFREGGDESIYENGVWETALLEIQGWYFWKEPEGNIYGLFSAIEDALLYSGNL